MIATTLGILPERTVILLKHQVYQSSKATSTVKSEVYNQTWRLSKLIDEGPRLENCAGFANSLTQGILYVEEGDPKEKIESFKWHREFNKQFDVISVSFNDPTKSGEEENI